MIYLYYVAESNSKIKPQSAPSPHQSLIANNSLLSEFFKLTFVPEEVALSVLF